MYFNSYSKDSVPEGSQIPVSSWWTTENSIVDNNTTYIVGSYKRNANFGYNFVNVAGFDTSDVHCLRVGQVDFKELTSHIYQHNASTQINYVADIDFGISSYQPVVITSCTLDNEKSSSIEQVNPFNDDIFKINEVNEGGISLTFSSIESSLNTVRIYDMTGRLLYNECIQVNGHEDVYLKFKTKNQLYLLNVSNQYNSKTIKFSSVK